MNTACSVAMVAVVAMATAQMAGCGSAPAESAPLGIYSGVVTLLPGATPGCAAASDPNANCCDDTQVVTLSFDSYAGGLLVDGWPARVDGDGTLNWQETDVETDAADATCSDSYVSSEHLTRSGAYSYAETATQTCAASTQSIQCAYSGQLTLQ